MKNNKGFTLVELLATVVIILLLGLIVTPNVVDIINENRNKGYHEIERRLEEAASKYIVNEYIGSSVESVIITKEDLINAGYIDEVYDLKDNSVCNASIYAYNLNSMAEFNPILSCSSYETKGRNAVWYIKDLYADESLRTSNGLIEDTTIDKNIRYAGAIANVKNKVYFNCAETDGTNEYGTEKYNYASSCEIWRIIGVFDIDNGSGKIEKRIKIVRDALAVSMSFDSSANNGGTDNNSGYGINQWGKSTYTDGTTYEGADLMRMLNGYYIGKDDTCKYCNGLNQGTCENDCTSSVTPLSSTSLSMVEDALWERGGTENKILSSMYNDERGITLGKICSSTSKYEGIYLCTDTVNRTTEWVGKIGLIYPSDYGYASTDALCSSNIRGESSTCKNNNWLLTNNGYWTFAPNVSGALATATWYVNATYSAYMDSSCSGRGVRPTLYLSSNVQIILGNGADEPYILGI